MKTQRKQTDNIRAFHCTGEIKRDKDGKPYLFQVAGLTCTTIYLKHQHHNGEIIKARLIYQYASDTGFYEFYTYEEI